MPLATTDSWKHLKTGICWRPQGMPDDPRTLIDRREEKRWLRTKDSVEAKRLRATASWPHHEI